MNSHLVSETNAQLRACIARHAGHEQRSPEQVRSDNSFVNLWLLTHHQKKGVQQS